MIVKEGIGLERQVQVVRTRSISFEVVFTCLVISQYGFKFRCHNKHIR
jgi:hypothetical protein